MSDQRPARRDVGVPLAFEAVLAAIKEEIVSLFGGGSPNSDVRVDIDVFDGGESILVGRPLDSMDLVHAVAAIEERFDTSLAPLLSGDEPLTLTAVAWHIARSGL